MAKKKKHKELKQCTLYVDGMHCPSCEILIEKKLLKQESVKAVDANLADNTVNISYEGKNIELKELNKGLRSLGYKITTEEVEKDTTPAFTLKGGQLVINPEKFSNLMKNLGILVTLLIAFFYFEKLQLGKYVSVDANSALPAFFVLGLVAGFSSCAALVGGMLLSMIKQWNEDYIGEEDSKKAKPHLLFHIGRLLSFGLLGGVLGVIGDTVSFDNTLAYSTLVFVISAIMLVLALQMLNVPWAQKFRLSLPKSFGGFVANESNFKGENTPFVIGALTFFVPCGFTLIAQGIALTSGSFITGSLIMLLFALGTLPMLLGISFSGVMFNKRPHLTSRFNFVAGILILFFVLYNVNGQLNVLGLPSLSDIQFSRPEVQQQVAVQPSDTNMQQLNFIARGFEYVPQGTTKLKAGDKAKLVVDNQGVLGCGAFIASQGLFDGFVSLKNGINEIDLGVVEKGTYKLTCSMGMVPPVTITVE